MLIGSFRILRRCAVLLAACTFVTSGRNVAVDAAPVTKIVAVSGTPAPDGNGLLGSLVQPQALFLNGSGQVAFSASLINSAGGSAVNFGVYRGDGMSLTQIARLGQAATGGTGSFVSTMSVSGINDAGQVSFLAGVPPVNFVGTSDLGLFLGNGTTLQAIVRTGQPAPSGGSVFFPTYLPTGMSGSGQVAFTSSLASTSGGGTDDNGVFLGDGMSMHQIAREGQTVPDGNGVFAAFNTSPAMLHGVNHLEQIAFGAELRGTVGGNADNLGIFLGSGSTVEQLARKGQSVPDGNGTFFNFAAFDPLSMPVSVNASSQVVFSAVLAGTTGGGTDNAGIFLSNGGNLSQVARAGQAAPNGNGRFSVFRDVSDLTDSGRVAFVSDLAGTTGGTADNSGIFRADGTSLVQIAREGQAAPDGSGGFLSFMRDPDVSEAGHVLFQASTPLNQGIYLYDDLPGMIKVAGTGDPLMGSSIANILGSATGGRGGANNSLARVSLDQNGQPIVAYGFRLADGRTGVALWSLVPESGSLAIVAVGAIAIALVTGWPPRSLRRASR